MKPLEMESFNILNPLKNDLNKQCCGIGLVLFLAS